MQNLGYTESRFMFRRRKYSKSPPLEVKPGVFYLEKIYWDDLGFRVSYLVKGLVNGEYELLGAVKYPTS